jgi:hypothetical protein
VGHTGTGGGFNDVLERFPHDDLTIVVLTNTDRSSVSALRIATRIARLVLALPSPQVQDLPVPPDEMAAFPATFGWPDDSADVVPLGANKLAVRQVGSEDPPMPILYQGNFTFAVGHDQLVKHPVVKGTVPWGFLYVGGLFMDAWKRH